MNGTSAKIVRIQGTHDFLAKPFFARRRPVAAGSPSSSVEMNYPGTHRVGGSSPTTRRVIAKIVTVSLQVRLRAKCATGRWIGAMAKSPCGIAGVVYRGSARTQPALLYRYPHTHIDVVFSSFPIIIHG